MEKCKTFSFAPCTVACLRAALLDACYANIACKAVDTKLVATYAALFRSKKHPRSIHHQRSGWFEVNGDNHRLCFKIN